jgi:hypothetical protein
MPLKKHCLAYLCAFLALLVMPGVASAKRVSAAYRIVATGTVSGTVTQVNGSYFTVATPGTWGGVVDALTSAATKITSQDYPYVFGGGHARASVASVGTRGPGYNGHRKGFDCSGSVAAVLSAGGLWPAGAGVPNDYWVIKELLQRRLIAPGPGTGPVDVMLYDDPGVHIFMSINGGFFGTSDGGGGGNPRGGAGWLYDGAYFAWGITYKRYHVVPSALTGGAGASHKLTFEIADPATVSVSPLQAGQHVRVAYTQAASGALVVTSIS